MDSDSVAPNDRNGIQDPVNDQQATTMLAPSPMEMEGSFEEIPLEESDEEATPSGAAATKSSQSSSTDSSSLAVVKGVASKPFDVATKTTTASDSASRDWLSRCFGRRTWAKSGRDLGVWESSLEDRANCFAVWSLSYVSPLLAVGSHKVLDADDIGVPSRQDLADQAYEKTYATWQIQSTRAAKINEKRRAEHAAALAKCSTEEQRKKVKPLKLEDPSIAISLLKAFGVWKIVFAIFLYVISALLGFIPVLLLNDLVKFFESGQSVNQYNGLAHPWVEVVALGVIPLIISIIQTRHNVIMSHCAVFARTAVSTMLYRKALRVSAAGRAKTSTGQVVNMMSNDTAQLQRFLQFGAMILVAPLQIVIALVLIFGQVGNATWVGVGFMVFLAPINTVIFSIVSKQRRRVLKYSDMRVKMMNEILGGIRIIKFYAWERPFGREVANIRRNELEALTKLAFTTAIGFSLILMAAPLIQPVLVFLTYVAIQSKPMDAATAFTTVALFNIMRFPFAFLPMGLLQYIQSRIALRRLERYFDLPELTEYVKYDVPPDTAPDEPSAQPGSVTVRQGSFSWVDPDGKPIRPIQDEPKKKAKGDRRASRNSRRGSRSDGSFAGGGERGGPASDDDMRLTGHSMVSSINSEAARGPTITLQDLSVTIEAGGLVAVVGPVGCGKSSFLSALLGELEPINNSVVYMPRPPGISSTGFVSYCSQTPWVVNDTLRGNVLFGRPYDPERYDRVIEACALLDDLAVLPAGDLTEIGERGINLSGGQKARVSLARALYSSHTKLILMDDPLSAVDAHVGEHIFHNAIAGDLAQGMTRVLVTHHVHLLERCDSVLVLEHGHIKHYGPYKELVEQGVDFVGAIDVSRADRGAKKQGENGKDAEQKRGKIKPEDSDDKKAQLMKSGKKLVKDEEREEGNIAGSAYYHYANAGGIPAVVVTCIVQAGGRAAEIMGGFWLAFWAKKSVQAAMSGDPLGRGETNYYVGIYALFGFVGVLGLAGRSITIAIHRMHASRKLHNDLTESVLRAPVSFFDVTPTGRILNRFAADMDKVDLELTQSLSQGLSTLANVLGAVGAIIAATKGTFLAPLFPIGYGYYLIQKWFTKTSTELQRINSIANSPIFADFSQTLSGPGTIRAYGEESRFFEQCKHSFDNMNASYMLVQNVNSWLGLRLDALGGTVGAFIGAVAVGTSSKHFIPAGWLGLALSYSIEMTNYMKLGVRMVATIEAQMNSVERILFYTNKIEPEAPEFIEDNDPKPGEWPKSGAIEIKDASMRYRDGPLVLKGISACINPGEKVGVCGRTGSGKSSLMIALFRICELERDGGMVLIDDVNTSAIGTAALRLNLSIIPQDPIIFSNTVRYNLDPFGNATDAELWEVLKKVQMDEVIAQLPQGLTELVSEGGENFSQGQRQLLCIARALLRKPKVLVLDEATASIDNATDAAIQKMIRENFADATVLTIAHRLNTIMDSDRVLVLDDGRVAEYDSPDTLLKKDGGLFRAMVERSRHAQSGALVEDDDEDM